MAAGEATRRRVLWAVACLAFGAAGGAGVARTAANGALPASTLLAQANPKAGAGKPAGAKAGDAKAGDTKPGSPAGGDYTQRFASECAACHGANGRSDQAGVPVLAGQPSLYVATQLFLFREGRRPFAPMVALARQMSDADLRGFSDAIGRLPPQPAPPPPNPPDEAKMEQGHALARQHRCLSCHGEDLSGGQQVPRIGGQKEDYVRATLHGFKDGSRAAYTRAMPEALSQVPEGDLDVLAYYAAHVRAAPSGSGGQAPKPPGR